VAEDGRYRRDLVGAAKRYFEDIILTQLASTGELEALTKKIADRKLDPYSAARILLGDLSSQVKLRKEH
jgi:hypothetical protein